MILGYNTNGLAHHRLLDALDLCAELGYGGVAITVDVGQLDPLEEWQPLADKVRERAKDLGLALAIETGARFVLDPARKHEPNLMSPDPAGVARRVDFYQRCIAIASAVGAPLISLWSGAAPFDSALPPSAGYDLLCQGLVPVLERARQSGVLVCFEPEPGMFVESPSQYLRLLEVGGVDLEDLRMTLDVGHCLVTREETPEQAVNIYRDHIAHVHLDDIRDGEHVHRMFGEGDLDVKAVMQALRDEKYSGMAAVELSRDSHRGAEAAARAFRCLHQA